MTVPAPPVRTRIAPSPTGDPHVGTAYTALFNLALARQRAGQFVLRVEDTDRERYRPESEQRVFEYLHWLGLTWDEGPDVGGPFGPYRQSERLPLYRAQGEQLVRAGQAYWCWCSRERLERIRQEQQARGEPPKYDRYCLGKTRVERAREPDFTEPPVLRLKVPDSGETSFTDLIRGEISFQNALLDDQVLLKSDGFPTYHLAVVVDDHEMRISHVMRGEEWIPSTPKHVLLYQAFGWELPAFAHLPILRNVDRSKISKRRNPWAVLPWFREQGYLPEALLNFLALMGFSIPDPSQSGETREVFGFDEVVQHFAFDRFSTTSPVFDLAKLDWLNGVYIRGLPLNELLARVTPYLEAAGYPVRGREGYLLRCLALEQERLKRLGEAPQALEFFLRDDLRYPRELLIPKGWTLEQAEEALALTRALIEPVEQLEAEPLEAAARALAAERGWKTGSYFGLLRVACTGRTAAPPLFATLAVLGRDRVLTRLCQAQELLAQPTPEAR